MIDFLDRVSRTVGTTGSASRWRPILTCAKLACFTTRLHHQGKTQRGTARHGRLGLWALLLCLFATVERQHGFCRRFARIDDNHIFNTADDKWLVAFIGKLQRHGLA